MQAWRHVQSNQPDLQTLPQEHPRFVSRPFNIVLDDGDLLFSSLRRERVDQGSDCEMQNSSGSVDGGCLRRRKNVLSLAVFAFAMLDMKLRDWVTNSASASALLDEERTVEYGVRTELSE